MYVCVSADAGADISADVDNDVSADYLDYVRRLPLIGFEHGVKVTSDSFAEVVHVEKMVVVDTGNGHDAKRERLGSFERFARSFSDPFCSGLAGADVPDRPY